MKKLSLEFRSVMKGCLWLLLGMGCFYVSFAFAEIGGGGASEGLGGIASKVSGALTNFATLVTGFSFLAGLIFAILAILKFKAHRDAPTQVTLATPIVYMFVAVGLLFLPTLFKQAGQTLFGTEGKTGAITGFTELK